MKVPNFRRGRSLNNTGFDSGTSYSSGRVLNKDGSNNVVKSGLSFFEEKSMYHTLINISPRQFILMSLLGFFACNLFFATIYYVIGIEHLGGNATDSSDFQDYLDCFFFSTQTLTTVGYGVLHPISNLSNFVSSIETLFGWMGFAVLTGLLYGRFSRPTAYVKFSENLLITPHKGHHALMFRLAPYKNNSLTDAEVQVNVTIQLEEDGKRVRKYFTLETEYSKIISLALSWTVVHLIDEASPLYGLTFDDFNKGEIEVLVFFKAYDEHFSNTVQTRTSYIFEDFVHNAKFVPMFRQSEDKKSTILELDKINTHNRLDA
ncbi:MAG: Inward rectifier potassium channel Irk [Saprospiraceae bacterium]|nr:Inward rectifier potassium channel Irk [Saprospiraceae bacterium]